MCSSWRFLFFCWIWSWTSAIVASSRCFLSSALTRSCFSSRSHLRSSTCFQKSSASSLIAPFLSSIAAICFLFKYGFSYAPVNRLLWAGSSLARLSEAGTRYLSSCSKLRFCSTCKSYGDRDLASDCPGYFILPPDLPTTSNLEWCPDKTWGVLRRGLAKEVGSGTLYLFRSKLFLISYVAPMGGVLLNSSRLVARLRFGIPFPCTPEWCKAYGSFEEPIPHDSRFRVRSTLENSLLSIESSSASRRDVCSYYFVSRNGKEFVCFPSIVLAWLRWLLNFGFTLLTGDVSRRASSCTF